MNVEKKKNPGKNHNKHKVEEPETAYKTITISTLEQLKELDRDHTRKLSPKERMHYLYQLNENVYGFDLSRQAEVVRKGKIIIRRRS